MTTQLVIKSKILTEGVVSFFSDFLILLLKFPIEELGFVVDVRIDTMTVVRVLRVSPTIGYSTIKETNLTGTRLVFVVVI